MPRPPIRRCVAGAPCAAYFKPQGIRMIHLQESVLSMDEFEALRLADAMGMSASEASLSMGVSRHTFGRILKKARRAVAGAIVNGRALRIEGGHYQLSLKSDDNHETSDSE